jgi:hypothetical protein
MHRSLAGQGTERALGDYVIHGKGASAPIVGRLVDKGLHDELAGEAMPSSTLSMAGSTISASRISARSSIRRPSAALSRSARRQVRAGWS